MMKGKNTSRESYVNRLKYLSGISDNNNVNISESKSDGIGALENFTKASNGINYGIIRENHKYYIKKGGRKEKPSASDFTYIGGLANKNEYRYNTLSEADKNRNMILQSINEIQQIKLDSKKNKMILEQKENVVEQDEENKEIDDSPAEKIEKIEDKMGDLEDKTEKETQTEPESDIDDLEIPEFEPEGGEEPVMDEPEPEPEGGEEPVMDEPEPEPEGGEEPVPDIEDLDLGDDDKKPEGAEGEEESIISNLESKQGKLIHGLNDVELENEQVKWFLNTYLTGMKDYIGKLEIEEKKEMANKILKAGVEDEDVNDISKSVPQDIEEEKCNECGSFSSFLESKGYTLESVLECSTDEMANNISEYANAFSEGMNDGDLENMSLYADDKVCESLLEYGHDEFVKQMNECGTKKLYEGDEDRISKLNELWKNEGIGTGDTNQVQTQPNLIDESGNENEEEENELEIEKELEGEFEPEKEGFNFAPDSDSLGAAVVKPESTSTEVNVDTQNKTLNIKMNESEEKIRKYVKQRINEKRGLVKPKLNESKKSDKLKKLDEMIDEQFENYEKESKIRKYVRNRLEEKLGKKKPVLNESKKSNKLKKLDRMIDEQFNLAKKLREK
jgi:hypothetical protein